MDTNFYFAIINLKDCPIYELSSGEDIQDSRHLNQFIIHASLDVLDDAQWTATGNYLRVIDRFNEFCISAYVLNSGARFLILHESISDDGIKNFFVDVHELYVKLLLNPFFDCTARIQSSLFDSKVKLFAKRYF